MIKTKEIVASALIASLIFISIFAIGTMPWAKAAGVIAVATFIVLCLSVAMTAET